MKCVLVFSSLPDLLYLWMDPAFDRHLTRRAKNAGIWEEGRKVHMYAEHLFSPLVTSNKYMQEINQGYKSFVCLNGFVFVMKQMDDLFFISVCGDGTESELFMQRKLTTLHYLLRMHYGPCIAQLLKPNYQSQREVVWQKWNGLIEQWSLLSSVEHMFLVDSLERLHVNQQLSHTSLQLLADVLKTTPNGEHALLLVNNKLLAAYSRREASPLRTSDILALILIAKQSFGYTDPTLPRSVNRGPTHFAHVAEQRINDTCLFRDQSFPDVDDQSFRDNNDSDDAPKEESSTTNWSERLYLQEPKCSYSPHDVSFTLLHQSIVIVVIAKSSLMKLARVIESMTRKIDNIVSGVAGSKMMPSYRRRLFEDVTRHVARLLSIKSHIQSKETSQALGMFEKCWEKVEKLGIREYLMSETPIELSSRLCATLSETKKKLNLLFYELYTTNKNVVAVDKQVGELAGDRLRHFHTYLHVRGTRNVTMTAYHHHYPSLVHFIYLNRQTDQLIAPTINIDQQDSNTSLYTVIKQKMWDMWQHTPYTNSYDSSTSAIIREGDFTFACFFWFEETLEEHPANSNEKYCFQLATLHIGGVSNEYVATCAKKLSQQLYRYHSNKLVLL